VHQQLQIFTNMRSQKKSVSPLDIGASYFEEQLILSSPSRYSAPMTAEETDETITALEILKFCLSDDFESLETKLQHCNEDAWESPKWTSFVYTAISLMAMLERRRCLDILRGYASNYRSTYYESFSY
jgi:hypothetical protein